MKQNSLKSITMVSVIIIVFCALSAALVVMQGIVSFIKPENMGVTWSDSVKGFQLFVAIGRPLGGIIFFGLITTFLVKTIKGLKNGNLFPAANVPVLYVSAIALFIYNFCYSNGGILTGSAHNILIDTDDVAISLIVVVFAMIYRIAVKVSEENSLTI
ncbi:MAG: DUF2975 domain-containing protein [Bacteroidales bacterium]|nr:DUF2975 domain-containing protein [Bacteroidales bacterium]MBQ8484239.1 DUF2975 domain-containing protein [Bacteroidales bacterium]MBR2128411.1 DUF2975 domain-containing protein [Bacteroidales bacterium]